MRAFLVAAAASFLLVAPAAAQEAATSAQATVDAAAATVKELSADAGYSDIAAYVDKAKAVMIVPQLLKAGFIIGGEIGDGVVLSRAPDGGWSAPAFYSLAGGSIGLQAGAEARQVIIAVMTDKGLNELMSEQLKVGVDASISVGTVGGGAGASSVGSFKADMVAFSRSEGLFGGGSLDGSLIRPQPEKNAAYYGAGTTVQDILIQRRASNAGADKLQAALSSR